MCAGDPGINAETDKEFVSVGYIARTHGIKGDVKVIPLSDVPGRYNTLKWVYVNTRSGETKKCYIRHVRKANDWLIVSFTSFRTVSEAEEIVGGYISVPLNEVPGLDKDIYYNFEIIGMDVYTVEGRCLGKVKDIISTGSNDVYIVKDNKAEHLIPAIRDVVKEIDTKRKRMVITLIEGLDAL